jgi:hypothetical protein
MPNISNKLMQPKTKGSYLCDNIGGDKKILAFHNHKRRIFEK